MNSIARVPAQLARTLRPAVEATLTPEQLVEIFGDIEFKTLEPFAAPEPSIGAAVRLASGRVATLAYGKGSHLLRVDLPANDPVNAFLGEVTLPDEAISWRRPPRARPASRAHAAPKEGGQETGQEGDGQETRSQAAANAVIVRPQV